MYKVEDGEIVRVDGKPLTDADRVRLCVCANMFATHDDPVALIRSLRDLVRTMANASPVVNVSFALPFIACGLSTLNLGDES